MALVIPNIAGALIAMRWNLHGPQLAISTACASSLDAIGLASGMIERGEIDAAIAGGSETLLSPLVYESLVRAGALSRNPNPERASRPFDVDRDGFVMGDGAAFLILERVEIAAARGATIPPGFAATARCRRVSPSLLPVPGPLRSHFDAGWVAVPVTLEPRWRRVRARHASDRRRRRRVKAIDAFLPRAAIVTSLEFPRSQPSAGAMYRQASIVGMREGMIPPTMERRTSSSKPVRPGNGKPAQHIFAALN
jgi:hypothetical protein